MTPMRAAALAAGLLAIASSAGAHAQGTVVIYRCTDAAGAVTLQNGTPCPKGAKQEVRRMTAPPPGPPPPAFVPPAPTPAAAPAAPAPVTATPAAAPLARTPPAPLFMCRKWNGDAYFGDTAEPPAECVPLEVRGIDGSQTLAAGQACEMRRDDCTAVPADQLCTAWKRRVDEAEFRAKFAPRDATRQAEFARVRDAWQATTCAP